MSYEHCDPHDQEATNGCHGCAQEEYDRGPFPKSYYDPDLGQCVQAIPVEKLRDCGYVKISSVVAMLEEEMKSIAGSENPYSDSDPYNNGRYDSLKAFKEDLE